jgi:hypothetical protein
MRRKKCRRPVGTKHSSPRSAHRAPALAALAAHSPELCLVSVEQESCFRKLTSGGGQGGPGRRARAGGQVEQGGPGGVWYPVQ